MPYRCTGRAAEWQPIDWFHTPSRSPRRLKELDADPELEQLR